jgi:hypothetical protein
MRFHLPLFVLLVPMVASADGLTDLRATLGRLAATTPVHGTLDVTSTSRSNEDEKADDGKASVGFEIGDGGLHIIYPHAMLTQATQESRAEARDPERSTPIRSGASHIRPLHVAELLDGAAGSASSSRPRSSFRRSPQTSAAGRPTCCRSSSFQSSRRRIANT